MPTPNLALSIVILNWNAAQDTIACIKQIKNWQYLKPSLWIVDNASTDGSQEIIAKACSDIHLICNPTNSGFSGGTNKGISASLAVDNRPIMLLNNDANIAEKDVKQLLTTLQQDDKIGLVGPLLFDAEDKNRLLSAGAKNPVLHHQTRILSVNPQQSIQLVPQISGTAIIIKADLFKTVGLLDERYFFSTELADLCTRANKAGYLSVIDNTAKAYHTVSRSAHFRNNLYIYYIVRNRFIYIRKFYNPLFRLVLLSFWGKYSFALSLKLYLSGQPTTAKAVQLALLDGLQKRFGGQNERVLRACQSAKG